MSKGISKDDMEQQNIKSFLPLYNQEKGEKFEIKKHRDKPDFLIYSPQSKRYIGVEVTLAILHDEDEMSAKQMLRRPDVIMPMDDFKRMSNDEWKRKRKRFRGPVHASKEYVTIINESIKKKNYKCENYDHKNPIILVIGLGEGVFGLDSIKHFVLEYIRVSEKTPFSEIWINIFLCIEKGQNGIIQIK